MDWTEIFYGIVSCQQTFFGLSSHSPALEASMQKDYLFSIFCLSRVASLMACKKFTWIFAGQFHQERTFMIHWIDVLLHVILSAKKIIKHELNSPKEIFRKIASFHKF